MHINNNINNNYINVLLGWSTFNQLQSFYLHAFDRKSSFGRVRKVSGVEAASF